MKFIRICIIFFAGAIFCAQPPAKTEFRIVSLSPAATEIIFALGAGKNLVGVTTYCDYPESAQKIYKVGDFSNPSLERILNLKPDLVIINLPEQNRIKKELEKFKINLFISSPKSLDDIYGEILSLGRIISREKEAESLCNYLRKNIKPSMKEKKRVYLELSPRPLITIGATTFLNELLSMAGGENIFSDLNKDYPVVAQEEVIKRNPEIIIVLHPEEITNRLGWEGVTAFRQRRIYKGINQDWLLRPGPRLVLGFKELERILE